MKRCVCGTVFLYSKRNPTQIYDGWSVYGHDFVSAKMVDRLNGVKSKWKTIRLSIYIR